MIQAFKVQNTIKEIIKRNDVNNRTKFHFLHDFYIGLITK